MRTGKKALPAILAAAFLPAGAMAQPGSGARTITVAPTASWGHAGTGMVLPPSVGGLVRDRIEDNSADETDAYASYVDRGERMVALVYIYRTGAGDLPLWFDRTVAVIGGAQAGAGPPAISGFTRPGASVASGLRTAMADNVSALRTTAVAIAPLGQGWLIKIRMGSATLEPDALAARLTAFAAALRWPAEAAGARAAVPVEACPEPLRLREARILRPDMTDVLMDSVVGSIEPEPGQPAAPPPVFCREPGATAERGVYRPDRSTESYLIGINDAGLAIGVGNASQLSALLGNNRRRYSVTLYERGSTSSYASFNRLPPPDQAWTLVRTGQPLSTSSGGNVTISTGAAERR